MLNRPGGQTGGRADLRSLPSVILLPPLLLSRLPVFWHSFDDDSPPDFVSAQWAFPAVGLIVGGIAGLVLWLAILLDFPVIIAATLALAAMLALTGAMHEDGLADTVDGFGGGGDAKSKARIAHDSHIGSYGVMGLCLSTIARIGLLVALVEQSDGWLLVIIMAIVGAGALSGACHAAALSHQQPCQTWDADRPTDCQARPCRHGDMGFAIDDICSPDRWSRGCRWCNRYKPMAWQTCRQADWRT